MLPLKPQGLIQHSQAKSQQLEADSYIYSPPWRILSACRTNTVRNAKVARISTGINLNSTGLPKTTTVPSPTVNHASTARTPYSRRATGYRRCRSKPARVPGCSSRIAKPHENLVHRGGFEPP